MLITPLQHRLELRARGRWEGVAAHDRAEAARIADRADIGEQIVYAPRSGSAREDDDAAPGERGFQ